MKCPYCQEFKGNNKIRVEVRIEKVGVQLATKDTTPQNQDFHRCPNCDDAYYANAIGQRIVECPHCGNLAPIS